MISRDEVLSATNELKGVFDTAVPSTTMEIVKQAGEILAANITQYEGIDKFSSAVALYELCLIDANAFFNLIEKNTPESDSAAAQFLAEAPKMLAQLYAAITLLS